MTTPTDTSELRVVTPVPMHIAGPLMELLGRAWPGAAIRTNGFGSDLTFVLPGAAKKVPKRAARAAVAAHADDQGDLLGVEEQDGMLSLRVAPPEEASVALGNIAYAMLQADGATNYLEAEVVDHETGDVYVVCAARSKDRTPHALRMAAEAEVERLREQLGHAVGALEFALVSALGANVDPATLAVSQVVLDQIKDQM